MALLILSAACSAPQPGAQSVRAAASQADVVTRWWCVYASDGFSSHCERTQTDCEQVKNRSLRPAGACTPEPSAYCFRYVSKGFARSDTVVLECSVEPAHCEDTRARVFELGQSRMLGECEDVE
jgi:hypothetical protein